MTLGVSNPITTVSQLTAQIKTLLENNFRFVAVSGEISNLKTPFSGHHYFTLKDSGSQLRAVLFKGQQRYLMEKLRDGQQVVCRGRISLYEPRGEYQLIVDTVDQFGIGVLQIKFAALKKKLAEEGLFDPQRKQPLPAFPRTIVVISSPTGAAIQDFLKICRKRATVAHIQILPVAVQGETAAPAIARAIKTVNSRIPCDLLVLCRGGGSIEDLWAFNEECVARAIFASKVPVVTGVGHETDTTIADLCADMRAPTPTGAAELVIPDTWRLSQQVLTAADRLKRSVLLQFADAERILDGQWRHLLRFRSTIESLTFRLDPAIARFYRAAELGLQNRRNLLNRLVDRLGHQAPLTRIAYKSQTVRHLQRELQRQMLSILRSSEERLALSSALLQGVSPLSTLSRGYAIVQRRDPISGERKTVSDSRQVSLGEHVDVLLHRGKLLCEVLQRGGGVEESNGGNGDPQLPPKPSLEKFQP